MKVLDLFSGIGGFSLGLEWAGMETIAMCEKDKFCRQVLAKHWPDITIHEDIRKLDGREYKNAIDVVCGGFPCQPFSVAGKQLGKEDDRHLWPEMLRVIRESKPRWVIGENVSGFVSMALDDVSLDLENEGYEVRPFVLPACAVDARHRRDRVFIIAYRKQSVGDTEHDGLPASEIARGSGKTEAGSTQGSIKTVEPEGAGRPSDHGAMVVADTHGERQLQREECKQEVGRWSGDGGEEGRVVANATDAGLQGREIAGDVEGEESHTDQQFAGFGYASGRTEWTSEPAVGRMAHGVPNRVDRIKSLGNAVVPQLVQRIGELVYAEHHRSARD
jgi:DNA (cytosine-5)-methyltransferase 1